MADRLVSVMMPCFNSVDSLPMALASLFSQTYENWECILVDDGSTDDTSLFVSQLKDPRIRLYRFNQNRGRGTARQFAMERSRGDFLTFLDADDWMYPEKLERQVQLMSSQVDVCAVSTTLLIVGKGNSPVGTSGKTNCEDGVSFGALDKVGRPPFPNVSTMFRMEDARQAHYKPELLRAQDMDFTLQIILGKPYAIINEPLYCYSGWLNTSRTTTLESLKFESHIFFSYFGRDPLSTAKNVGVATLKRMFYGLAYATKTDRWIISRRINSMCARELVKFEAAERAVGEMVRKIFATEPQ